MSNVHVPSLLQAGPPVAVPQKPYRETNPSRSVGAPLHDSVHAREHRLCRYAIVQAYHYASRHTAYTVADWTDCGGSSAPRVCYV